jgi:Cft2 family RNA processing exonuclease
VRGRNSNVNSVIELKDKAYEYFRWLLSSWENLRNFKEFFVESSRKNKKSNKCSRKDLPSLKDRLTQIPELLFTEEDIEDIKKRIIINNVWNILNLKSETTLIPWNRTQSTKTDLKFLNAWHIEWSVQAQITETSLLVSKALLPNRRNKRKRIGRARGRIKTKIDRYVFSWDLWRLTYPNLAGKPDIPKENINFLQIEWTYSWRNHPEKEQSVRDFFSAIENAPWKVLIPCFSMQRTQEILMLILEEQKRIVEKISQLNREIRAINVRINNIHTWWRKRAELNREIWQKEKEIDSLEKKVRDSIFVDWFISKEITEIYLKRFPKKYRLLLPDVQRKIFWKEIVKYLSFWEYNNLYGSKKTGKGQPMFWEDDDLYKSWKGQPIIISGSWMCQWWAIMNHLPKILPDKNATIVFVWYTTNNTNWWRIKERKSVKLHWKSYGVKCNTVDIKGFSAHIDQSDILKYISQIKFSLWAVLSINHWWPERQELAEEVRQLENVIKSEVNVIVPNCGDKIKL